MDDPLDNVFSAMRVKSAIHARIEARGRWGLSLVGGQSARFGLVVRGGCLLSIPGQDKAITLAAGDCYVLPSGAPYVLCDDLATPTVSCTQIARGKVGGVVEMGEGGTPATIICGWFNFDEETAKPLVHLLPPVMHVRMDEARTLALQGTLQLLAMETELPDLASGTVISRLADIIFIQALRAYIADASPSNSGWIYALKDPKLSRALYAIHQQLHHPWTVETLASTAGLSRSSFASRFKKRLGKSPLEYLRRWRMFRASCLLRQGELSIGKIAASVGYDSDAAFHKAFKRSTGIAPGEYRRSSGGL